MTKQDLEQYRSIVAELSESNSGNELLEEKKTQVDNFINAINDLNIKRIFKKRYIDGKYQPSFQQIALDMGYIDEGTPRLHFRGNARDE